MAKTTVGLEITEECVRAVEITVGRAPALVSYGEAPLPADAARDSEVLDQGAVAVALRQLWTRADFTGKQVVLGVASRRILVREYATQMMRPDLLRESLPYQVQDLLPVPASQAVLDFYPLAQDGDRVNGLLVAAVSETIETIITTLDRVKLRLSAVDLGAFGLARATAGLAPPDVAVATVFIGDHTTQLVVAQGGVPLFVRLLPIDIPTAASQRRLAASGDDAVSLDSAAGVLRAREALRTGGGGSTLDELAARVRSTLAFYANRPGAVAISQFFATGAGMAVDGMAATLESAIETPLAVVKASDIVTSAAPPAGDIALDLVSTIGIAMGGAR